MLGPSQLRREANRIASVATHARAPTLLLAVALGVVALSEAVAAAPGPAAAFGAALIVPFPLQLCEIPLLGDLAAWILPSLRQVAIFGGIATALYGAVAAPADFAISPRKLIIGGLLVFGVGLLWVGIVTYLGTDVLGGDASLINAATCGMDTGA